MDERNQPIDKTQIDKNKQASPAIKTLVKWLYRIVQGAIIGTGAILPGVSGGALCVIFGIYQPMMALLAHPFRAFKTHVWLLLPVLIGWVLGFFGLAKLVNLLLQASPNVAAWLFVGLIAGMLPSLYKEAGKEGHPKSAWISFAASTVIILGLLLFVQNGTKISLSPNIGHWLFSSISI